jgi:hypothetical protein
LIFTPIFALPVGAEASAGRSSQIAMMRALLTGGIQFIDADDGSGEGVRRNGPKL